MVLLNFNLRLLMSARPLLDRILVKNPCRRFRTRCDGSNVSLFGPLLCSSVPVIEPVPVTAADPGSSRVVDSERVERGAVGRIGRVRERRVNARLRWEVGISFAKLGDFLGEGKVPLQGLAEEEGCWCGAR